MCSICSVLAIIGFSIFYASSHQHVRYALQTFVISPKEKTTVWVKQNVNFFQQNGSVIKIEQN
jgi:hypothetical protein